ncbi:2,3-diaminopropionate biosynthesis protein SbnB [Ewingella americana]|uniref:2,3-diaminopropionate biosynthesis protein SbnB n=1 Tax=Ewingella americana TaxID=41202 RepID=A0A377TDX1_9GAMM|nr:2,3-diaminopropionate biosynthesis protein SbnB [Ewingella americana]
MQQGRIILQVGYHEMSFEGIRQASKVVADLWGDFCQTSAKSLFQMYRAGEFSAEQLDADLAQLLIDHWRPSADDCVYFSSFGLNVFDIALAAACCMTPAARDRPAVTLFNGAPDAHSSR